jgi:hypothetical protein
MFQMLKIAMLSDGSFNSCKSLKQLKSRCSSAAGIAFKDFMWQLAGHVKKLAKD